MLKLVRTNSNNQDFSNLVKLLDSYLKITDGDEHDFYNQFNHIDILNHVVLAYIDSVAVGCGAFKTFDSSSIEIKRMYIMPKLISNRYIRYYFRFKNLISRLYISSKLI